MTRSGLSGFSQGCVRDSLADISRARELLGFSPQVDLQQDEINDGLVEEHRFAKQ